ncbi:MAG: hypothetical protein HQL76_06035 [Magnetococcales bacterium]|nr:hypothetical protein [Magnetococcales bacterium]
MDEEIIDENGAVIVEGTTINFLADELLILAAPDLLAACQKMIEAWDCRCPEAGIVAIQQAVSKAKGGAA